MLFERKTLKPCYVCSEKLKETSQSFLKIKLLKIPRLSSKKCSSLIWKCAVYYANSIENNLQIAHIKTHFICDKSWNQHSKNEIKIFCCCPFFNSFNIVGYSRMFVDLLYFKPSWIYTWEKIYFNIQWLHVFLKSSRR
jgi:hypothetical protein